MAQLIEFASNHWILCSLFIVILLMLLVTEAQANGPGSGQLTTAEVVSKLNRDQALLFDLRPKEDYKKGHITQAVSMKKDQLLKQTQYQKKAIILVCSTGQESMQTSQEMKKNGFETVMLLKGGLRSWEEEGLPLIS